MTVEVWGRWTSFLHVPAPVAGPSAPADPSWQCFHCRQRLAGAKLPAAGPGPCTCAGRQRLAGAKLPAAGPGPCRMTDLPIKFAGLAPAPPTPAMGYRRDVGFLPSCRHSAKVNRHLFSFFPNCNFVENECKSRRDMIWHNNQF